jgi:hypothetical protein
VTRFALVLIAVYLTLGLLFVLTFRASEAVFKRVPTWTLLLVYLGAAGLLAYTLAIGNPLAYIAAVVIVMGLAVYVIVKVLPRTVPHLLDGPAKPFRRDTARRRRRSGT